MIISFPPISSTAAATSSQNIPSPTSLPDYINGGKTLALPPTLPPATPLGSSSNTTTTTTDGQAVSTSAYTSVHTGNFARNAFAPMPSSSSIASSSYTVSTTEQHMQQLSMDQSISASSASSTTTSRITPGQLPPLPQQQTSSTHALSNDNTNISNSSTATSSSADGVPMRSINPLRNIVTVSDTHTSIPTATDHQYPNNNPASFSTTSVFQHSSSSAGFVPRMSNALWGIVEYGRGMGRSLQVMTTTLPPGVNIVDIGDGKRRVRTKSMSRVTRSSSMSGSSSSGGGGGSISSGIFLESLLYGERQRQGMDDVFYASSSSSVPLITNQAFGAISSLSISSGTTTQMNNSISDIRGSRVSRMHQPQSQQSSMNGASFSSPTSPSSLNNNTPSSSSSFPLPPPTTPNNGAPSSSSSSPGLLRSSSSSRVLDMLRSPTDLLRKFREDSEAAAAKAAKAVLQDRLTTTAASAVLAKGFSSCNAGLKLHLEFEELSLTLAPPISKTILQSVTGEICPGRVTAILGPSGAGKTTFLSVLMGRTTRTAGNLRINGRAEEMSAYRRVTGFVPQEDVMLDEMSVRENIEHSARIRLPRSWSNNDFMIRAHVDAIIEVLGLVSCADTPSARISGGQRKRTNIGMELAAAPAALFLDEPTSGLDATAALEVCATLRSIANHGLIVVAVIHQPRAEIFTSFDDLLLLAPGGRTVYMGPQSAVLDHFVNLGMPWGEKNRRGGGRKNTEKGKQRGNTNDDDDENDDDDVPSSSSKRATATVTENPADTLLDFIGGRFPLEVNALEAMELGLEGELVLASTSSSSTSSSQSSLSPSAFSFSSSSLQDEEQRQLNIVNNYNHRNLAQQHHQRGNSIHLKSLDIPRSSSSSNVTSSVSSVENNGGNPHNNNTSEEEDEQQSNNDAINPSNITMRQRHNDGKQHAPTTAHPYSSTPSTTSNNKMMISSADPHTRMLLDGAVVAAWLSEQWKKNRSEKKAVDEVVAAAAAAALSATYNPSSLSPSTSSTPSSKLFSSAWKSSFRFDSGLAAISGAANTNPVSTTSSSSSVLPSPFPQRSMMRTIPWTNVATMQSSHTAITTATTAASDSLMSTSGPSASSSTNVVSHHQRAELERLMDLRGAPFHQQFLLCCTRAFLQQYRQISWFVLEISVIVAAGAVMGLAATAVDELYSGVLRPPFTLLSPSPMETMLPSLGLYINMAIGVAGAPAAVRIFGEERDMALREARAGHSVLAYYLAKNVASLPRLCVAALHFAGVFSLLAKPTAGFHVLLGMSVGIFFGVYGLAVCVSLAVSRANASLLGVIACLIISVLCGYGPSITQFQEWGLSFVHECSYSRWANELWINAETAPYRDLYLVEEVTAAAFGYTLGRPGVDIGAMIAIGLGLRAIAFVGLSWLLKN